MDLILASNKQGKIAEIKALLPHIRVCAMREAGFMEAIEEPFDTFRQNAFQKANTLWQWAGAPVLGGAPGVYSARYAGENAGDAANNEKLLRELQKAENRSAHYYAILCLIINAESHYFEGRCDGRIAEAPRGNAGFGYDPLFIPEGYKLTSGELDTAIKSCISHRAKALQQLLASGLV